MNYDRWLEAPYTDRPECDCEEDECVCEARDEAEREAAEERKAELAAEARAEGEW